MHGLQVNRTSAKLKRAVLQGQAKAALREGVGGTGGCDVSEKSPAAAAGGVRGERSQTTMPLRETIQEEEEEGTGQDLEAAREHSSSPPPQQ